MNQEPSYAKLLDTAREAGGDVETMTAFAALVAAAEREKVAKQWEQWYGFDLYGVGSFIRARGETK